MEYQINNIFIEKPCRNVQQKLVPDFFIIFVNNPKQPLHVINYFKSKIFERGLSKSLKKGNFIFSLAPSSFQ